MKKPFLLKRKKPQETLQIKFTIVKSIIKFQICQPYVCLTTKKKFHYFFFLPHTIFLLDCAYHKTLFFLHYYVHCKFSFFFASLCNINQSLTKFSLICALYKFFCQQHPNFVLSPLHYLLSKNLISRNSLVFHTKTTQK